MKCLTLGGQPVTPTDQLIMITNDKSRARYQTQRPELKSCGVQNVPQAHPIHFSLFPTYLKLMNNYIPSCYGCVYAGKSETFMELCLQDQGCETLLQSDFQTKQKNIKEAQHKLSLTIHKHLNSTYTFINAITIISINQRIPILKSVLFPEFKKKNGSLDIKGTEKSLCKALREVCMGYCTYMLYMPMSVYITLPVTIWAEDGPLY